MAELLLVRLRLFIKMLKIYLIVLCINESISFESNVGLTGNFNILLGLVEHHIYLYWALLYPETGNTVFYLCCLAALYKQRAKFNEVC